MNFRTKIRNIERTEEAKQKLIEEKFNPNKTSKQAAKAGGNVSVNYVQHKRYMHHEDNQTDVKKPKRKPTDDQPPPLVVGDTSMKNITVKIFYFIC